VVLSGKFIELLRRRAEAHEPIILIDVPGDRPGSEIPLYYVVEAQRRALRKDERVIGEVHPSEVWGVFGEGLRERAGKVRVYCHPSLVDTLEAALDRTDFVNLFEAQTRRL